VTILKSHPRDKNADNGCLKHLANDPAGAVFHSGTAPVRRHFISRAPAPAVTKIPMPGVTRSRRHRARHSKIPGTNLTPAHADGNTPNHVVAQARMCDISHAAATRQKS